MRYLVCITAFLPLAVLIGCAKPPAGRSEQPPAPVLVTAAAKKTVPIRIRTIGTVKTIASVSIRPRVGGELTEVFFQEGDFVKQNQKLFTIDPRPYVAAVKQAEANMVKNIAILRGAEVKLKLAEDSKNSGVGAITDYDTAFTAVESAKASVEADRTAINTAKLQLEFTTITSPLEGRVGELLVSKGNL